VLAGRGPCAARALSNNHKADASSHEAAAMLVTGG